MVETPRELGFYLPAEWEKHSAIWLAWPNDETAFPNLMKEVEQDYCQIIKSLEDSEKINLIITLDKNERVKKLLQDSGINLNNITFFNADHNDVWVRDYMPTFVVNQNEVRAVKWNYNGYGKSDDPYFVNLLKDNQVFPEINKNLDFKIFEPNIILEGGAIEVNGKGTLITTEQCLLNLNRNSNLNKEQTEKYLKDYLGVNNIIWLKEGLINDHTDGHIDELAKFVNSNTIVCAYEDNKNDPNFSILDDNFQTLENSLDHDGNKFNLIKLPMPHMNYDNGEKAPVSYTNFYIGNSVVLVPTYKDPNDQKALEIIQSCFRDRKVIGIDCSNIIYGGGAIHCITMQQPAI
jgi:agmatine deiminase